MQPNQPAAPRESRSRRAALAWLTGAGAAVAAGLILLYGCRKEEPAAPAPFHPKPRVVAEPTQPLGTNAVRFDAKPGSKVRIEGTSNVHDWQVEGKLIGGFLEVGADFPVEPGQSVAPGPIAARAEAYIPVRSLTSIHEDGKPYSTKMDDIMYEKFKSPPHSKIVFRLEQLTLQELPKQPDLPYRLEAEGVLSLANVSKKIRFTANALPQPENRLKIFGSAPLKMTDFGIEPPQPAFLPIKTGDDIKVFFEWTLARGAAAAPAQP